MNNLNLIISDDQKQIDFYLKRLLNNIEYVEDNKITYDLNNNTISDILDESSMISLFADIKIIVGLNLDISKLSDNDLDYLSKYVINPNKNSYIILIASKVDARLKNYKIFKEYFNIIESAKIDNKELLYEYTKDLIKSRNYKINNSDLEYFLSRTGDDINNINSELEKLFIYKETEKIIETKDIELLVQDTINNVIYEFTNAILDNDLDKVVSMYNNFKVENIPFDYLIVSIYNNIKTALIIKILNRQGENNLNISKKIGKKEFYVKKTLERIQQYTEDDLANFITKLAKVDKDFKSGNANNIDYLEFFIIDKFR